MVEGAPNGSWQCEKLDHLMSFMSRGGNQSSSTAAGKSFGFCAEKEEEKSQKP